MFHSSSSSAPSASRELDPWNTSRVSSFCRRLWSQEPELGEALDALDAGGDAGQSLGAALIMTLAMNLGLSLCCTSFSLLASAVSVQHTTNSCYCPSPLMYIPSLISFAAAFLRRASLQCTDRVYAALSAGSSTDMERFSVVCLPRLFAALERPIRAGSGGHGGHGNHAGSGSTVSGERVLLCTCQALAHLASQPFARCVRPNSC